MGKIAFTAGRVSGFRCPADKAQAFLWDVTAPGLGLRATPAGKPSYVFQSRFQDKTIRLTIGNPGAWSIPQAQEKARELQRRIDEGKDPRDLKRDALAAAAEKQTVAAAQAVTVGEAWAVYVAARRPYWGAWQYHDQLTLGDAGGLPPKRGKPGTVTRARPIHPLMALPLASVTAEVIEDWAASEAEARKSVSRRAHSCLKTFFSWCMEQKEFRHIVTTNPAKSKKSKEVLGRPAVRQDALQREQLPVWFAHVRQIPNPIISAYLQCLLLTGSRREEMAALKWEDVNFQWNGLDLKDKIEGRRAVPLTPYVRRLIEGLPRRNEWVFSSVHPLAQDAKTALRRARYHERKGQAAPVGDVVTRGASGRLKDPSNAHRKACAAAGLEGLTLHGLRRSFASLCEWLDIPGGISAQIQGHAPQGVREQNYIRRPLDLLRLHHEKIEAWILEQAGVPFVATVEPGKLALVAG